MVELFVRVFAKLLNMSLTAGIIIVAVLVLRLCLKKVPKIFSYALWAVVLFRLLCPFSFRTDLSLLGILQMPVAEEGQITYIESPVAEDVDTQVGIGTVPGTDENTESVYLPSEEIEPVQTHAQNDLKNKWLYAGTMVWGLGVLAIFVYSVINFARFAGRLKEAVHQEGNIYCTPMIDTPFVCGIIRPRIYLPQTLELHEKSYIVLHEKIHIKRGDNVTRVLAFLALTLHWFNPLVWLAFVLSAKDMEMSCDEAVIRKIGSGSKKEYSASLLNLATGKRIVSGIPLAFGEGDTGSRIKNVLRYKKPALLITGVIIVVCVVAAVFLLGNPGKGDDTDKNDSVTEDGSGEGTAEHSDMNGNVGGTSDTAMDNMEQQLILFGIVQEISLGEYPQQVVSIPRIGDLNIPSAEEIVSGIEPETGDLIKIVFTPDKEVLIQETYPGSFSTPAETIEVMEKGYALERLGNAEFLFTFPKAKVLGGEQLETGDMLEIYRSSVLGTGATEELLVVTEVVAIDNAKAIPSVSIKLSVEQVELFLRNGTADIRCVNTDATEGQEGERTNPISGETITQPLGEGSIADGNAQGVFNVNIRTLAKEERLIDNYIASDISSYDGGAPLVLAENCIFKVNYEMAGISYEEVSYDTFAEIISQGSEYNNKPAILTFEDNVVVEAVLKDGLSYYGITFSEKTADTGFEDFQSIAGENMLEEYYTLVSTESKDIADAEGIETIEVYTGNIGDGDSGFVIFYDAEGNMIYSEFAHQARAGWNNVYIGEVDGNTFIMTAVFEDRGNFGGFLYEVFRLSENGDIRQIAGSSFSWDEFHEYNEELFTVWGENFDYYMENSYLVLSSQDSEVRTEKVCEAEKYNTETLREMCLDWE
ncbi:MAG: hypothetical protein J6B90_00325 [Lachnospiraceae bacterium]|nr:hypothetical protein [Lachnospiraceae bacterium]